MKNPQGPVTCITLLPADAHNLKPLIDPIADYLSAATDPKAALVAVLYLLIFETSTIESSARRHLERGRH